MAINNITQTISTLPPAGSRGVDVQTQFVIKQEDFQDHLQGTTVNELNTLKDQLNSRIGEINSTVTTMNGYANTASAGASTATTKAGEASASASDALAYKNQAETFKNNASTSATKAGQWADNNYNVEVEAGRYSAKHWSTVAQNTVNNKIDKVVSTDNAIVRFDGTSGNVQDSGVFIDDSNKISINDAANGGAIYLSGKTGTSNDAQFTVRDANRLDIEYNGAKRVSIDNNGNVGIGTSSPGYKVDITNASGGNMFNASYTGGVKNPYIRLGINSDTLSEVLVGNSDNTCALGLKVNGTERVRIGSAGNVGIGTTNGDIFSRGYGKVVGISSTTGSSSLSLNASTGNASFIDLGVNGTRVGALVADTSGTNLTTVGNYPLYFSINGTAKATMNTNGDLLLLSGGLGYGTGAGGTVTQLTSKSTAVILNKPTGQITMNSAALAAGASVGFSLYNNLILGNQDLLVITTGGASNYDISYSCGTGIAFILVKNKSAGSLSEAIIINFTIIKGAIA